MEKTARGSPEYKIENLKNANYAIHCNTRDEYVAIVQLLDTMGKGIMSTKDGGWNSYNNKVHVFTMGYPSYGISIGKTPVVEASEVIAANTPDIQREYSVGDWIVVVDDKTANNTQAKVGDILQIDRIGTKNGCSGGGEWIWTIEYKNNGIGSLTVRPATESEIATITGVQDSWKIGEWVEVLDTRAVRNWSVGAEAIGHKFQLRSDSNYVEMLNTGHTSAVDPDNKYGINYRPEDLKRLRPDEIPQQSTSIPVIDESMYKVGQRVLVKTGDNCGKLNIKGIITAVDKDYIIQPRIDVRDDSGLIHHCYPIDSRKLDVEILSGAPNQQPIPEPVNDDSWWVKQKETGQEYELTSYCDNTDDNSKWWNIISRSTDTKTTGEPVYRTEYTPKYQKTNSKAVTNQQSQSINQTKTTDHEHKQEYIGKAINLSGNPESITRGKERAGTPVCSRGLPEQVAGRYQGYRKITRYCEEV